MFCLFFLPYFFVNSVLFFRFCVEVLNMISINFYYFFLTFCIWVAKRSGALSMYTRDQLFALSYTGYLPGSRPAILEDSVLRSRHQGCRAGAKRRSLGNKMDQLWELIWTQREYRGSSIWRLTET